MVPKFANPHSLPEGVERTTRLEIAERAGSTSTALNEDNYTLKRDLDAFLCDTWASALAEMSNPSRAQEHRNVADNHECKNDRLAFRLVSSMKHPQHISLDPKPPPAIASRGPDCEDDETQAETRKIRSLSVAVDFERLGEATVSTRQLVTVGAKIALPNTPFIGPLPPLLVTEEARAKRAVSRVKTRGPQANESCVASPHEPQLSCPVLPVISDPNQREVRGKKRRKPVRERPPPAYWRPSPDVGGKCMGHALGYPSSWAPDLPYVRDTMKSGVETGHAVRDGGR